jgi:hypothetical protein
MRSITHGLAVLALSLCAGWARGQVFMSSGSEAIPDGGTLQSTINVFGGPGSISGVRVVVHIHHGCDSDLDLALVRGDTYLRLSSANGEMGQHYASTRFADAAPHAIYEASPPYVGTFRPEGGVLVPYGGADPLPPNEACGLSAFVGRPADGDWTLWVSDNTYGFTGAVTSWSLEFDGAEDFGGPPMAMGAPDPGTWFERGEAGAMPDSAQVCAGMGNLTRIVGSLGTGDTDMYRISVCDPANFTATTVGGAYFDTALYLFDTLGNGVSFNDDEPGDTMQSLLTPVMVPGEGVYYLAVTAAGRRPLSWWAQPLWEDEPAVAERRPDGPGVGPVAMWSGWPEGGMYRVTLTGTCYSAHDCGVADFNGDGENNDQDIIDFFACVAGNCCPTCGSTDVDHDGLSGTEADIVAFFRAVAAGC